MAEEKRGSTRKNYRWHWTTVDQIEELKQLVPHTNETDLLQTIIREYLEIAKCGITDMTISTSYDGKQISKPSTRPMRAQDLMREAVKEIQLGHTITISK